MANGLEAQKFKGVTTACGNELLVAASQGRSKEHVQKRQKVERANLVFRTGPPS